MSRPVLIVDIGAGGLPSVTPVEPILASWVPAVYVAPPPPSPTDLLAEPISDGVLLTWNHAGGRGIEFRIERAVDVAGVPGTWIQIGQTADLRYTATTAADRVDGYWFRVRAVRNGKYSDYTGHAFQWPYASNPPVQILEVSNSTITIDCRYNKFKLLLDQDVNYVGFINVPQTKTVLIYSEQSGGSHVLTFPSWVKPIDNVPFVASPVGGATDIIGLDTENAGLDWALVAQQPAGGGSAFAMTAWPAPAHAQVVCTPTQPKTVAIQVYAEQVNGVAPVTYDWARIDSYDGPDFAVSDIASAAPTFSIPSGNTAVDSTQVWRCTCTDNASRSVNVTVTVRLVRIVAADANISTELLNPGFELGDTGWTKGPSCAIVAAHPYTGTRSLQLNTGYFGQSETVNDYIADVVPGQVITARCMIHQGASDSGKTGGWVRIKWYNAAGGHLSDSDGNNVNSGSGGAQHPSTITSAVVPVGAAKARLAVLLYRNGQNYVCNADDCSWARLS